jgi:acetolactate synthase-1/3 small subunit
MVIDGKTSHTLVALVQDKPGVLNRVASMFRRRGYNIASLAVGHSEIPNLSRMTFVVEGDDSIVEQATKQLYKLIDVVRVNKLSGTDAVSREMALIKVKSTAQTRSEIIQMVEIFKANIVDVSADSMIVEVTGDQEKIDSFHKLLAPFGVKEVMRTGRVAMDRGKSSSYGLDKGSKA